MFFSVGMKKMLGSLNLSCLPSCKPLVMVKNLEDFRQRIIRSRVSSTCLLLQQLPPTVIPLVFLHRRIRFKMLQEPSKELLQLKLQKILWNLRLDLLNSREELIYLLEEFKQYDIKYVLVFPAILVLM